MERYSVVTGAAAGLGRVYAESLAKRQHNIIAIDLPGTGLPELTQELAQRHGVKVNYYETDLTIADNVTQLSTDINRQYQVSVLVNNAGVGGTKRFDEADPTYLLNMIQLNIMATTLLTRGLISNLKQQPQAYVLNVASMAAFTPIAYKTVYPASKAYIYRLTQGLREEFKSRQIHFCVTTPGPMVTNPEVSARIKKQGFIATMTMNQPERIAEGSLTSLFKGRSTYIPNPVGYLFLKIIPNRWRVPLISWGAKREFKDMPSRPVVKRSMPLRSAAR